MPQDFPFKDIVVIELASVLAAPSVGMFFAELGATVIKVENAANGGDVTRSWKIPSENQDTDISAYFSSINWGKRSIAVDLDNAGGKKVIRNLIQKADVVLASFKPGDAVKLAVDYDSLSELNPALIYGEISGYGSKDSRTAFDAVLQAETGFMFMNGTPESGPVKMPVALIDLLAGHQLKEGLLLALLKKEKTGKGSLVSVSLYDAAIASLANQGANWLVAGINPQRMGSAHPSISPYGDYFQARDGKLILLAVGNDRQFASLCRILMADALSHSPEFSSNPLRVKNREKLKVVLADAIMKMDSGELLEKLREEKVPGSGILSLEQVFSSADAAGMLLENGIRGVRTVAFHSPNPEILPPPHLNEHENWVRKEFLNE